MKRIKCAECKRQQFLHEALQLEAGKLFGRARFYHKQASTIEHKIVGAVRVSTLHPCSSEHRKTIIELRRTVQHISKAQRYEKLIMRDNAKKLYEQAQSLYAEAILKSGQDSEEAHRLRIKVQHYKYLLAQRERRLQEATLRSK